MSNILRPTKVFFFHNGTNLFRIKPDLRSIVNFQVVSFILKHLKHEEKLLGAILCLLNKEVKTSMLSVKIIIPQSCYYVKSSKYITGLIPMEFFAQFTMPKVRSILKRSCTHTQINEFLCSAKIHVKKACLSF